MILFYRIFTNRYCAKRFWKLFSGKYAKSSGYWVKMSLKCEKWKPISMRIESLEGKCQSKHKSRLDCNGILQSQLSFPWMVINKLKQ